MYANHNLIFGSSFVYIFSAIGITLIYLDSTSMVGQFIGFCAEMYEL